MIGAATGGNVGRADIQPALRPVLDELARNLDPGVRVWVVGHTDSTGSSDATNRPLSVERAQAVRRTGALRCCWQIRQAEQAG